MKNVTGHDTSAFLRALSVDLLFGKLMYTRYPQRLLFPQLCVVRLFEEQNGVSVDAFYPSIEKCYLIQPEMFFVESESALLRWSLVKPKENISKVAFYSS